jgi:PKD repeat protein
VDSPATQSHTYHQPGLYTVTVTVADNDGGETSETLSSRIVIYERAGGFVTGGGWINSPAGAYTPQPGLSGRAQFVHTARYRPRSDTPTGVTLVRFAAGRMTFRASNHQWLTITGDDRSTCTGTGTINRTGHYNFMITTHDASRGGRRDTIRIKIWDADTGATIYDNQPGAPDDVGSNLAGGNITIHTRR